MNEIVYSIILGLVQGITEFLPISSTGHLIIFRDILNLNVEYGLAFDAVLQLATAIAVIVYFRKDLLNILLRKNKEGEDKIEIKYLIIASIPAIIFGFLFQDLMESIFRSTTVVALTLILGAIIMLVAEKFIKTGDLNIKNSFAIGLFQSLALIPGMSRSGMTISGGYFMGIKKDLAIKFSFLLSIPIIAGSGLYKLLEIIGDTELFVSIWQQLLVGSISAFIFGILSIDFLIKFLKNHTFKGFVIYRIILALALLSFVFVK
jgi:undecaprenyl-diphosphatase